MEPRPAVLEWLKSCQLIERDCLKGKQQKYFRGVFEEAANTAETDEENEDNFVEACFTSTCINCPDDLLMPVHLVQRNGHQRISMAI